MISLLRHAEHHRSQLFDRCRPAGSSISRMAARALGQAGSLLPARAFVSLSHHPHFNLSLEHHLLRSQPAQVPVVLLYRNDPCIVIGRNQNPWSECNLERMKTDHVYLARRTSGGGAVYHDLGNTNFTFLSPREGYDRSINTEIVLSALRRLGVTASASGRNDLVIEAEDGPRKFSGSAFRETRDRAFHHGTFLLNVNLDQLSQYLTPHPKKLISNPEAQAETL